MTTDTPTPEALTVATTETIELARVDTRLEHDLLGEREIPTKARCYTGSRQAALQRRHARARPGHPPESPGEPRLGSPHHYTVVAVLIGTSKVRVTPVSTTAGGKGRVWVRFRGEPPRELPSNGDLFEAKADEIAEVGAALFGGGGAERVTLEIRAVS